MFPLDMNVEAINNFADLEEQFSFPVKKSLVHIAVYVVRTQESLNVNTKF